MKTSKMSILGVDLDGKVLSLGLEESFENDKAKHQSNFSECFLELVSKG